MWDGRRQRIVLDRVQWVLVVRVFSYWLYCLLAASLIACCWIAWMDAPASSGDLMLSVFRRFGLVFAATAAVMPLVLFDVLRLSHRFAGPMFRLRQALRQAAEGENTPPLHFRDDDFWRDVAEDFNRAFAHRMSQPGEPAATRESASRG
ncbi:MAG: hypothetical protein KY475_03260 [Planctomycetes bacterium]|nr:hypothetical protein [Planctomycetota bacterium]